MLWRLLARMDRAEWNPAVISLTGEGPLAGRIRALGVPVETIGMPRGIPCPAALWRLMKRVRHHRPRIIQTWMYHADLLGGIAARCMGGPPVIWGVHHSNLDPRANKRSTLWTMKACALLAPRLARRIVCCSGAALESHAAAGYPRGIMQVIPNGFDTDALRPDAAARAGVRAELALPGGAALVGWVGRFHAQKDPENFIRAAGLLKRKNPGVVFVLCGRGMAADNAELAGWVRAAGLGDSCRLLGERPDAPRLLAAFDVLVNSSRGEAFPLTLGEAMACGTPCVVTDVGDCAAVVGDVGRVVPPENPEALADALDAFLRLPAADRAAFALKARERIIGHFSIQRTAEAYAAVYREALGMEKPQWNSR